MKERDLRLIGLGMKAGFVVVGTSRVRDGLKQGQIHLVVLAEDLSVRTEEKVGRLARAKGVRILEGPGSSELGMRFGGKPLQTLGLLDVNLAREIGKADIVESR
jgi:ribosomal protein L7Ae-like RNA K-turn-binding protein